MNMFTIMYWLCVMTFNNVNHIKCIVWEINKQYQTELPSAHFSSLILDIGLFSGKSNKLIWLNRIITTTTIPKTNSIQQQISPRRTVEPPIERSDTKMTQGSSETRSCQRNVNLQLNDTCRVMQNTSRNQTSVNTNLIMVPITPITYSSAHLHKIINVLK